MCNIINIIIINNNNNNNNDNKHSCRMLNPGAQLGGSIRCPNNQHGNINNVNNMNGKGM